MIHKRSFFAAAFLQAIDLSWFDVTVPKKKIDDLNQRALSAETNAALRGEKGGYSGLHRAPAFYE